MNQYEILCDFCNKNIKNKKQFIEKLKNNDPASQAYLTSFFIMWARVFNATGKNATKDLEALGKGLEIGLNEIKTIYFEALKILKKEFDANDTTVPYAFAEGKADYQSHHILYVDTNINWSDYPD